MYSTLAYSLKLPSRMKRTYSKTSTCRLMTHFQYRNNALPFSFCVSQSYGKSISLSDATSRSLIKSAHWIKYFSGSLYIIHVYNCRKSYHGELFLVRISTNPEPSINCPLTTNRDCSIWNCMKMEKYWEEMSGLQNWSPLVIAHAG